MNGIAYQVYTLSEACENWGIAPSTLRAALKGEQFAKQREEGLVRKAENQWIIGIDAMIEVYQSPSYVNLNYYEKVTKYLNELSKQWYDVMKNRYTGEEQWYIEGFGYFRVYVIEEEEKHTPIIQYMNQSIKMVDKPNEWMTFEGKPNEKWRPFGDFQRPPFLNAHSQVYKKLWEKRLDLENQMWEKIGE